MVVSSAWQKVKTILLGTSQTRHRDGSFLSLPLWQASALLATEFIASTLFGTEAMFYSLWRGGSDHIYWGIWVCSLVIVTVFIFAWNTANTLERYPVGGEFYKIIQENLGQKPALLGSLSHLFGYVVSNAICISLSYGILSSIWGRLDFFTVPGMLVLLSISMFFHLRGSTKRRLIFTLPVYVYGFMIVGLFLYSLLQPAPYYYPFQTLDSSDIVPWRVWIESYLFGCVVLGGLTSFSSHVHFFQSPVEKNAKKGLLWMTVSFCVLFALLSILFTDSFVKTGLPELRFFEEQFFVTLVKTVFHDVSGTSMVKMSILVTASILFLATITGFLTFPKVSAQLAQDLYFPRSLRHQGERKNFSNGVLLLSFFTALLLLYTDGNFIMLVQIYGYTVFVGFFLTSFSTAIAHRKKQKKLHTYLSTITAILSLSMTALLFYVGSQKLALAYVGFVLFSYFITQRIRRHYRILGSQLNLETMKEPIRLVPSKNTVIIPVSGIHRGVMEAIRYSLSTSPDVRACLVDHDHEATERVKASWEKWAPEIPLVILASKDGSVLGPLIHYIDDRNKVHENDFVTVVIPEFVTKRPWHRILHNQTAFLIKASLLFKKGKVVTSFRYYVK